MVSELGLKPAWLQKDIINGLAWTIVKRSVML